MEKCTGEGNGNPLQCSCLENPRVGGAWWAAVYGVTQSRTWLKWLSSSSSRHLPITIVKILQARLQQYVNCEIPDVQAGLRKEEEPEIKLPTSTGSSKEQESSRKTSTSAPLTTLKPLTVWITASWTILKEMGTPYLPLKKPVWRSRGNS